MAGELDLGQLHRLSVEDYHRLVEAGGFDEDARVELLDGLLAQMSPKTRAHENAVTWLARWLVRSADPDTYEVRVSSPLTLGDSEPEPDLAVISLDAARPYHPATATLIIEVAVSSQRRDLGVKPQLYAAAGVPESWVLDLDRRRLLVHRHPTADGYSDAVERGGSGRWSACAIALPELVIADVLAPAAA